MQGINIIADTNLWSPDQFDVNQSSYPAMEFIKAGLRLLKVSKNQTSPDNNRGFRVACNDAIKDYLHWTQIDGKVIQPPKLKIYRRCTHLIETLPALITDDKDVDDIADNQDDHAFDAFKYGFMSLYTPRKPVDDYMPDWKRKLLERQKKDKAKNRGYMAQ